MLTVTIPQKDGMDEYDYDPENPAVHIVDMSQNELEVPEDYTEEEKRSDILTYGMIGVKYRNGFEHPEYLESDKIYKITIRTTKLSNIFLPGHRILFSMDLCGGISPGSVRNRRIRKIKPKDIDF